MIIKELIKPFLKYLDFLLNTNFYPRLISQSSKIFYKNDYKISGYDLVFIHIMKTAGTSFHELLKEIEKTGVKIKHNVHFGISIAEKPNKPVYCTIIRNPIDRSISLYNHYCRDKKSPYHTLALKGFSTFMRFCPEAQNNFCKNYSGELDKDVDENIYRLAFNNLKEFKHILFFDKIDEEFEIIKKIYKISSTDKYHYRSFEKKGYDDKIKRNIATFYNYYDIKLYESINEFFKKKV
jgi:hypothetical protein